MKFWFYFIEENTMVDGELESPEITHGRAALPYIRKYARQESEIEQHDGESSNYYTKKLVKKID